MNFQFQTVLFLLVLLGFPATYSQETNIEQERKQRAELLLQAQERAHLRTWDGVHAPVGNKAGEDTQDIRTATGGPINTIMIVLTIAAFGGNAAFLCYVFWFSK